MGSRVRIRRLTILVCVSGLAVACGNENQRPEAASTDKISRAVTGASSQSLPWHVPTVESEGACSGTIYKRQWVITAAHCFPASWDNNSDGFISSTEIANYSTNGYLRIDGGANSSGSQTAFNADGIYKPSGTAWGQASGNNDIALVHIPSPGFYPEQISGYGSYYHTSNSVPVLNLDQWTTTSLEPTSWIDSYGWATATYLGWATGQVDESYTTWYQVEPLNGAGIACQGDSGGPGFWWGGNVWGSGDVYYQVGVISTGNCNNVSGHVSIYNNKSWIESIAGS